MIDVMIMKRAGLTSLSNLHIIVLFHPDCNYLFKYVGREMMCITEQTQSLAQEQCGSRKRHRAINLALNKTLTYDVLWRLKRPGTICSNHMKSCYNLIGHAQASIAMQRNGVPKAQIDCLFSTLQGSIQQVRTGYGDSAIFYGGDKWLIPLHGIGQGNGAGPAIWAVMNTPLLNILQKRIWLLLHQSHFSIFLSVAGYAFINDTDLVESYYHSTVEIIISNLKASLDTWEGTLNATCSAVVSEKTFWYLIDFKGEQG
jgi:hypothetical protein